LTRTLRHAKPGQLVTPQKLPDGWPLADQIGALGLVHVLSCGVVYVCVGVLVRTILRARPVAVRAVTRVSVVATILIGALLLVERLAG
jgi:threonine/homoserine/homoserine lactone efflux protein